jgi:hypothetical protein
MVCSDSSQQKSISTPTTGKKHGNCNFVIHLSRSPPFPGLVLLSPRHLQQPQPKAATIHTHGRTASLCVKLPIDESILQRCCI